MPKSIPGPVLLAVDITPHNPIQVSPADKHAEDEPALVHALDVVAHPGDGVGDAGVDTGCAEEGCHVEHAGGDVVGGGDEDGEAGDAEEGDRHVEDAARVVFVGGPADEDGED